jgi:tRNA wybutosine-synthesizing protein 3
MQDKFSRRKKDILSKADKSHIGTWDEKIVKLCGKINAEKRYYTTSSCSGRVILMIEQDKKGKDLFVFVSHDKVSFDELRKNIDLALKKKKKIKFKLEPCILHVNCKSLEDAEKLYDIAKTAGWKKSGIIGTRNSFTVELNATDRLEFPVIDKNKILVSDEFLKIIIEESNKKLEKNWEKIKKLEKLIK